MKSKILILGSSGFVGGEILKYFSNKNIIVSYFVRGSEKYNSDFNSKKIKNLIFKNDIIINCVGENNFKRNLYLSNYIFVKKIVDVIKLSKKKKFFLHISSAAVYGKYFHKKNSIINIDSVPEPISYYAKTKLKADNYIIDNQCNSFNFSIIRPSQVIGKQMKAIGFLNLVQFIKLKLFFFIDNLDSIRNYVIIDDLCNIVFQICKNKKLFKNKIYIVSRYSKLINIVLYIKKKLNLFFYPNLVFPKNLVLIIVKIIIFFKKDFIVKKGIIEGLSTSAKIKSNINEIIKIRYKNIYSYLNHIIK